MSIVEVISKEDFAKVLPPNAWTVALGSVWLLMTNTSKISVIVLLVSFAVSVVSVPELFMVTAREGRLSWLFSKYFS